MALPDDKVLLLHNPKCSKSCAAQALLTQQGIGFQTRLYLEEPLTRSELVELQRRLGLPVQQWVRRSEAAYAQAGLGPESSDAALLDALAEHPILLERPIVLRASHARVGRPTQAVLELFESDRA